MTAASLGAGARLPEPRAVEPNGHLVATWPPPAASEQPPNGQARPSGTTEPFVLRSARSSASFAAASTATAPDDARGAQRQTARDEARITSQRNRLALSPLDRPRPQRRLRLQEQRKQWTDLRRQLPHASRTELRRQAPALWTWLYRHDPEWLNMHVPPKLPPRRGVRQIDWDERDRQLCLVLIRSFEDLMAQPGRPIRASRAELARRCGSSSILRPELGLHLPVTTKLLEDLAESREAFAHRRLYMAARDLLESGGPIPAVGTPAARRDSSRNGRGVSGIHRCFACLRRYSRSTPTDARPRLIAIGMIGPKA
jgi:hypothetical protein